MEAVFMPAMLTPSEWRDLENTIGILLVYVYVPLIWLICRC